jgi:hypothetical protein
MVGTNGSQKPALVGGPDARPKRWRSKFSVNRCPERGQLCPRDPTSTNSRTRLSALLLCAGSWPRCAILESWGYPPDTRPEREAFGGGQPCPRDPVPRCVRWVKNVARFHPGGMANGSRRSQRSGDLRWRGGSTPDPGGVADNRPTKVLAPLRRPLQKPPNSGAPSIARLDLFGSLAEQCPALRRKGDFCRGLLRGAEDSIAMRPGVSLRSTPGYPLSSLRDETPPRTPISFRPSA